MFEGIKVFMHLQFCLSFTFYSFKEEELENLLENLATDFSQKCKFFAPKAFDNMVLI